MSIALKTEVDFIPADNAELSADELYRLGIAASTGNGAPLSYIEAHKWFNLAAVRGNEAAKLYRKELSEQMTRDDIATAQKSAREWLVANTPR